MGEEARKGTREGEGVEARVEARAEARVARVLARVARVEARGQKAPSAARAAVVVWERCQAAMARRRTR